MDPLVNDVIQYTWLKERYQCAGGQMMNRSESSTLPRRVSRPFLTAPTTPRIEKARPTLSTLPSQP